MLLAKISSVFLFVLTGDDTRMEDDRETEAGEGFICFICLCFCLIDSTGVFLLAGTPLDSVPLPEQDLDQRPLKRLRPFQMYSEGPHIEWHPVRHGDAQEFFLNCRSQRLRIES